MALLTTLVLLFAMGIGIRMLSNAILGRMAQHREDQDTEAAGSEADEQLRSAEEKIVRARRQRIAELEKRLKRAQDAGAIAAADQIEAEIREQRRAASYDRDR